GAYVRIFQRCGVKAFPVDADTGVMGGKFSHEFMVPAETGESEVVYCSSGDYAANIEKAQSRPVESEPGSWEGKTDLAVEKFPTPGAVTIEALTQPPYGVAADRQIKTLVYAVESKIVVILL